METRARNTWKTDNVIFYNLKYFGCFYWKPQRIFNKTSPQLARRLSTYPSELYQQVRSFKEAQPTFQAQRSKILGASYGSAQGVRHTKVTGCARVTKHTRVAGRTRVAKHTRIAGQARLQNAWERRVLISIGKKEETQSNRKTPEKGCKIKSCSSIQKYKQTKYMKITVKKQKQKKHGKNKTK